MCMCECVAFFALLGVCKDADTLSIATPIYRSPYVHSACAVCPFYQTEAFN